MQASIFKLCQIPKFVYEIPRTLIWIMSIPFHIHSNSYILYTYTYPKKTNKEYTFCRGVSLSKPRFIQLLSELKVIHCFFLLFMNACPLTIFQISMIDLLDLNSQHFFLSIWKFVWIFYVLHFCKPNKPIEKPCPCLWCLLPSI